MAQNEVDDETEAWVLATFGAGEADFRDRVVAELNRLDKFERAEIKGAPNMQAARIRRERADAMRGLAARIAAMPLKGDPSL